MMTSAATLIVRELDGRREIRCEHVRVEPDSTVTVGRRGDVLVGTDPEDTGISRRAVTVTATGEAWDVRLDNSNGAVIHGWGQPPVWVAAGQVQVLRWPRIGIRLVGSQETLEHWVLLEDDLHLPDRPTNADSDDAETSRIGGPRTLTIPKTAAVMTVFAQYLAWPPIVPPTALKLESAARRLGIGPSGVQDRLAAVQRKARQLGWQGQLGLMDPDYLYVLVRNGYVDVPPPHDCDG